MPTSFHPCKRPLAALLLGCAGLFAPWAQSSAATFFEDAQASLTCTTLATPAERATLRADWLGAKDAAGQRRYFGTTRPGSRDFHFRYLTLTQAIANLADEADDQAVRSDVLARIIQYAARPEVQGTGDPLFRQIQRCAWQQVVESQLGSRDRQQLRPALQRLLAAYRDTTPRSPVEDWPLVLALRDLRGETGIDEELTGLTATAIERGNALTRSGDAVAAHRAYVAAARGLLELKMPGRAYEVVMAGIRAQPVPTPRAQRWLAYPLLFDVFEAQGKAEDTRGLQAMFENDLASPDPADASADFDVFVRLAGVADTDMRRYLADAGFRKRTGSAGFERLLATWRKTSVAAEKATFDYHLSLTSLRRAQAELARRLPAGEGVAMQAGAGLAQAASYIAMARSQATRQLTSGALVNKRERLVYRRQASQRIADFARLLPQSGPAREQVLEQSFAMAQIASHNGASAVALSGLMGMNREGVTADSLTWNLRMIEDPASYLQALLTGLDQAYMPGSGKRDANFDRIFQTLLLTRSDVFENRAQFAAALQRRDPRLAPFMLGAAMPVASFQRLLGPGEALVATHVGDDAVHAWLVTRDGIESHSQPTGSGEVDALVARVRTGIEQALQAPTRQQQPYDAEAAWRLSGLAFGPFLARLKGSTRVYWYGDKALATLPPGVMLATKPARPRLSTLDELKSARFLADEFPLVSMAELSVYPLAINPARESGGTTLAAGAPEFLGVGGTRLSGAEVAVDGTSSSIELAGGTSLAELPRLEGTVAQLRAIETAFGTTKSTLWLGPDATRRRLLDTDLRGYRVLVLATHGFLPGEMSRCRVAYAPSLLVSSPAGTRDACDDALLTTRDISQMKLDADLVVLSACNTARSGSRGGREEEPFLGLAAAFGAAGARNLAVSHWPVMFGAASTLTTGMLQRSRAEGTPLDLALQQATTGLRAQAHTALEAHPAYWGPFVLVGSGRGTLRR